MSTSRTLSESTVNPNPFIQFDKWYKEHLSRGIEIPDSFSLGTASDDGRVSVRTVLLKSYGEDGFVFFTNYNSKKAVQLSSNNQAALLFYWPESGRQVRIEGYAKKVPLNESVEYFSSRPRQSQLAAWTSEQSLVIPDRATLERKFSFYEDKFAGKPVDKPQNWGGFRVVPVWFEFWQNRDFRLHDRVTYTKLNEEWTIARLAP
jgi:pyridoxamine 5'-phosphate oxidase